MAIGRVFPNEVDRIINYPGGPVGKEARALALQIARNASTLANIRLGRHPGDKPRTKKYERGFKVKVVGRTTEFEVTNSVPYANVIESGARPHDIRARRVSNLQFRDRSGRWRKVKVVRHPGSPAFKILETAAFVAVRQRYGAVRTSQS